MRCSCNHQHTLGTTLWHRAYRAWFDHDRAGHRARAAAFGWLSDRLVRGA